MYKKRGFFLMTGGLLLIAAAFVLTIYNLWDEHRAAVASETALGQLQPAIQSEAAQAGAFLPGAAGEVEIPDYLLNPGMDMPVAEIDGEEYIGVLTIPARNLALPVMSEWSYPRLRKAPCRYHGSAYQGNLIIAGHNYDRHFGNLKKLRPGEKLTFTDMDGNVFHYEVENVEILAKTDVEEMEQGDWELTLFTCTIGGETRVTVRCTALTPIGNNAIPASQPNEQNN